MQPQVIGPLIGLLIPLAFFAVSGWVVFVIVDAIRRHRQARIFAEFHGKLLERIGSARELGEFLTTEAGARFIESLAMERSTPQTRILRAAQSGVVLLCLGGGLLTFLWWRPNLPSPVRDTVLLLATIVVSLGVGFVLSAGASYVLSERMGILASRGDTGHRHPTVTA